MPPYTYLTFEEIEAKEWASKTVKTIFTDVTPVSFEAVDYNSLNNTSRSSSSNSSNKKPAKLVINDNNNDHHGSSNSSSDNPLRRSFSFLEGSLFSTTSIEQQLRQQQQKNNARRSQSTLLPSTSTITGKRASIQSAPTTPVTNKVSPHTTFSSRIRDTLQHHASSPLNKNATTTGDIFDQKKLSKEQTAFTVWKNTFAEYMNHTPTSLQVQTKPFSKRSLQLSKFIMSELLTTEETYLNHLMTIKNFYMDPLMEVAKKSSLVNFKDIEIIFAFIPQLITLSSSLFSRLGESISTTLEMTNDEDNSYGGCSIVNFSKSRRYLSKADSSIVYRQLVQDTMRKKETNRMLLSDYMIAPIQRITRYCLLLKDLLKYSDPGKNQDHAYLIKTLNCLSALAFAMNTIPQ